MLELYSSSRPYNRTSPRHAPQVAFLVMSDCDLQLPLYRRTCCPRQLEARNVSTVANIYLDRRYADRALATTGAWHLCPHAPQTGFQAAVNVTIAVFMFSYRDINSTTRISWASHRELNLPIWNPCVLCRKINVTIWFSLFSYRKTKKNSEIVTLVISEDCM